MSSTDTWLERYRAQAPEFVGAGIPWMDALRERAIDRFSTEGWPTSRHETWRHTSLALLQQQEFAAPGSGFHTQRVKDVVTQVRHDEPGHWMVFVDGRF